MIKTTLKNINLASQVINQLTDLSLPAKLSYKIGKLARYIEKENKEYLRLRLELFKKIGCQRDSTEDEKRAGSGSIIYYLASAKQEEDFRAGMKDIEDIEVELPIDAIALDAFAERELSAKIMQNMEDIIVGE